MLVLNRTYLPHATHGVLTLNGIHLAYTLELAWRNNAQKLSCIPEGIYTLRKRYSEKFKWHYVVLNVPNRSYILLHAANNAQKELQGCIAPVTRIVAEGIGTQSKRALQLVMEQLATLTQKGLLQLHITSNTF